MIERGHNSPPPFEAHSLNIEDLVAEAQNWLDGEPIATQAQADDLGRLMDALRKARGAADKDRKVEKQQFDEGAKAIQAKWTPLLERCDMAVIVAKRALTPFLEAQETANKAAAATARAEADRKAEEARQAAVAARSDDLAAQEAVEAQLKAAAIAERDANRADKAKASVAGGARSVGLVTKWFPVMNNPGDALRYYSTCQPAALKAWLLEQATKDVAGGARVIPGFTVDSRKEAR